MKMRKSNGKEKRFRGHYCKVCKSILSNEKFSGSGHSSNICKRCSKLTLKERKEKSDLDKIYGLYGDSNLFKTNNLMLNNFLKSESEKVRLAAKEKLEEFYNFSIQRKIEEEYEEKVGLDTENDEYFDDEDGDIEDLCRIDGDFDFDYSLIEDDDELPF